jgi:surfeit locus 1 family protein
MIRTVFGKRYILITLFVLAAMAVMSWLGIWQLDRREQRLARNADIMAKQEQPARSLNDAAAGMWALPDDRSQVRNVKAQATGQNDFDHQIVLREQLHEGQPGVHLVAPLVLADTNQAVLVDRGWIPEDQAGDPAQYDEAGGQVSVEGLLQPSQVLFGRAAERAADEAAPATSQLAWYRIDVEAIQGQMPYELLPVYLLQSPSPVGGPALPARVKPSFDLSEGPHMSYALQWFAFALTAGIVYLGVVRNRERKRKSRDGDKAGLEANVEIEAEGKPRTLQGANHA